MNSLVKLRALLFFFLLVFELYLNVAVIFILKCLSAQYTVATRRQHMSCFELKDSTTVYLSLVGCILLVA